MAKVLFVCNNLAVGGIPRALVNLLKELAGEEDVSLLLFEPAGEYLSEVPDTVTMVPTAGQLPLLGVTQSDLKKRSRLQAARRAVYVAVSRVFGNGWARKRVFRSVEDFGPYDVAVSYAQDNSEKAFAVGCNDFVLQKVRAKKKIACVHCDFEHYGGNTEKNRRPYYAFDRIVCVSDGCRDAFVRQCPELADRTVSIENCTDYAEILHLAQKKTAPLPVPDGAFVMLTVARIYPEKGIPRAIKAAAPVLAVNPDVCWVLVGDGTQLEESRTLAKQLGLQERILFLGRKGNPYPYIKKADLFFLPSVHEAAPMVFEEARTLGVPVLTTQTTSSRQMVEARGTGFVCGNTQEEIGRALAELLADRGRLDAVRARIADMPCGNERIRGKWKALLEEKT